MDFLPSPTRLFPALWTAVGLGLVPFAHAAGPLPVSPSPDGRYVFLQGDASSGQPPLDLADKATGKVLQHLLQQFPGVVSIDPILWKPDSSAFALSVGTGRFDWNVSVSVRKGDTFESMQFPEMPRATIPAKYGPDTRLTHWDAVNTQKPIAWLPDGSLLVEITSAADDGHTTVTATRSVTIHFPAGGPARLVSTPVRVTTRKQ